MQTEAKIDAPVFLLLMRFMLEAISLTASCPSGETGRFLHTS